GHGAPAPVGAPVQELPGVLGAVRVAADQQRHHVVGEVGGDRQLPAVQRRVPQARQTVVCRQLQGHEVAVGAGDDHLGLVDDHGVVLSRGVQEWWESMAARNARARSASAVRSPPGRAASPMSGPPMPNPKAPASRKSPTVSTDTPPTGMIRAPGNGSRTALTKAGPRAEAGNSLTAAAPRSMPRWISVGEKTPGSTPIPCRIAYSTDAVRVGVTMNCAPAATARS